MIVASRLYGWGRLVLFLMVVFTACHSNNGPQDEKLYEGFRDPPPEARPFVRWWWNGNRIEADELTREIELLRECGFGGVEINPIALPPEARETGVEPREWMSDKWIELLVHACQVVHDKEMIVDLIVGSGWPFGGEFLNSDEINQRVVTREIIIEDQSRLSFTSENFMGGLLDATRPGQDNDDIGEEYPPRVLYVSLMPGMLNEMEQVIDLTRDLKSDGLIDIPLQEERKYLLNYGVIQKGHREVMHGAPGASGPVMDHYKKDVTMAYLSRLKQISVQTGIPLSELIRALFCDSIELAGSNWTDGFAGLFLEKYGYELQPFLPFVFQAESDLRTELDLPEQVIDQTRRARFDYNRLLVDTFLENFTAAFQEFCDASDLRCRYQAYGTPFLMGMLEGYMIPDIPESNNWIYSAPMDSPSWQWNQDHGYMIWNLYAAAGGHLTGKRIISCEAMTNTRGVFKTSLEEIKQHDDMNFITGINHSV
ncbi:MAG: glycosyl hydrolase, partial [Bacteroidales bacterium]